VEQPAAVPPPAEEKAAVEAAPPASSAPAPAPSPPRGPLVRERPKSAGVGGRMAREEVKSALVRLEKTLCEEKTRREEVYRELQDTQSKVRVLSQVIAQRPHSATHRRPTF